MELSKAQEIANNICERIAHGVLQPGMKLTSERDLSKEFGVSRMTARHALQILEQQGIVVRYPVRGTFVANANDNHSLNVEPAIGIRTENSPQIGTVDGETLDVENPSSMPVNERLDNAESVINLAWDVWYAAKPKQASIEIYKTLPKLDQLLYKLPQKQITPRIQELSIRSHGLLGAICLDALDNNAALFHYTLAYQLATDGHNITQSAMYLALMGDTLRRKGETFRAISYLEQAREQSSRTSHATQGHILQLLAYTYADSNCLNDFERTIRSATDLLAFSDEAQDVAKKEFVPFEIYEIRGKANRDLGRPLEALRYLDLAEKSLRREIVTPRWYAVLDISKGQAYCDAGDITTGIELAMQGFTLAYQCRSLRQMNRVRKLLQKLKEGPCKDEKKVAELQELLYETYIHMDLER